MPPYRSRRKTAAPTMSAMVDLIAPTVRAAVAITPSAPIVMVGYNTPITAEGFHHLLEFMTRQGIRTKQGVRLVHRAHMTLWKFLHMYELADPPRPRG